MFVVNIHHKKMFHMWKYLFTLDLCLKKRDYVWGSDCTLSRVVAFPENFEQVGEADLIWMEDNSHHLSVACPPWKTQHSSSGDW